MGFSHLPGTPKHLPPPYPVAILCNGRSCLGSPTLCSLEDSSLMPIYFLFFRGILLVPASCLFSCCCPPPEGSPWPYLPTWGPMERKRDLGLGLSSILVWIMVWIWANYLTFLSLSFPLVNEENRASITGCYERSDETMYKQGLYRKASWPRSVQVLALQHLCWLPPPIHIFLLSNSFCNYYLYQRLNNLI